MDVFAVMGWVGSWHKIIIVKSHLFTVLSSFCEVLLFMWTFVFSGSLLEPDNARQQRGWTYGCKAAD